MPTADDLYIYAIVKATSESDARRQADNTASCYINRSLQRGRVVELKQISPEEYREMFSTEPPKEATP